MTLSETRTDMFPTHVGMNRLFMKGKSILIDVPHTRGDEPAVESDGYALQ